MEELIHFPEVKENLQNKLNGNLAEFSYSELVGRNIDKNGKSPKKRKDAVADSLLQISILPQSANTTGKRYTDDWTADGFLRWAVSLNFIQPNRDTDTYYITELGISFSRSEDDSDEELSILRSAFLSYPPATRVMDILDESQTPKNKFYIGQRLGFSGEKGFTSYDGKLMEDLLLESGTNSERAKIRSDIEGTSDKYARMIASWLRKVGYVKTQTTKLGEITSFQTYSLTAIGKLHLNRSKGLSSNSKHPKYVMWEFLATNVSSRDYVRTRRAYIIKSLMQSNSYKVLLNTLRSTGFNDEEAIIKEDIKRLINFGLRIELSKDWRHLILRDEIIDFDIPSINVTQALSDRQFDQEKAFFYTHTDLPHKFVELLSLAYDGNANRDFELITAELLRDIYELIAVHLGGGRKPDGVAYTSNFGVLYDTKAYRNGYSPSISEQDKMIRYVVDNQIRSEDRNPTGWWEQFPDSIPADNYYYLWISSEFKKDIEQAIGYVSRAANEAIGGALSVRQLLIGAAKVQKGSLSKDDLPNYINDNEINFGNKESLVN